MDNDKIIYECVACGKEMLDYEPEMCCGGYMCGCMGMPLYPPICSEACYNSLKRDQTTKGETK